jgi:hypothetical protein
MRDKKIFIVILILVLLITGGIGFYFSKKGKKETGPIGVSTKEETKEGRIVIPPITRKESRGFSSGRMRRSKVGKTGGENISFVIEKR